MGAGGVALIAGDGVGTFESCEPLSSGFHFHPHTHHIKATGIRSSRPIDLSGAPVIVVRTTATQNRGMAMLRTHLAVVLMP
jgi:hypothetical protein